MNKVPLTKFSKENLADMIVKEQAENTRLKELNREMYDTLKDVHFYLQQIGSVDSLLKNSLYQAQESAVRKILIKAEGREGEG